MNEQRLHMEEAISKAEWETCLRVLQSVRTEPDRAPDRESLERLIASLYKSTRKRRRRLAGSLAKRRDKALVEKALRRRETSGAFSPETSVAPVAGPTADIPTEGDQLGHRTRCCYICKHRYSRLHRHYHALCPDCASLNHAKRIQRTDLKGRRAMVTGGRIKIGYQTALKLLRDGAEVIVTTRFPRNCALQFAQEPDFTAWEMRLKIYGLDFRDTSSLLKLVRHWQETLGSLDILVNNAAQSVRRPERDYAAHQALEDGSIGALPMHCRQLLAGHLAWAAPGRQLPDAAAVQSGLSRLPAIEVPDLRDHNSWTLKLSEVEPVELLEVLLINTAAPFILTAGLLPLLESSPHPDRYVINVTGRDGLFDRSGKSDRHPHVNMSKAALNMMTRTSASDYASKGIYMNSVDTGWITFEGAHRTRVAMRDRGFATPLDEIDGAARIYDPVVRGLAGERLHGQLFRHYRPGAW